MQPDIIEKINAEFDDPEEALKTLKAMESVSLGHVSNRILRGIVYLSQGNTSKLRHYIKLALTDYRDLIWQAEYEDPEIQKYDFNKSFNELGLL